MTEDALVTDIPLSEVRHPIIDRFSLLSQELLISVFTLAEDPYTFSLINRRCLDLSKDLHNRYLWICTAYGPSMTRCLMELSTRSWLCTVEQYGHFVLAIFGSNCISSTHALLRQASEAWSIRVLTVGHRGCKFSYNHGHASHCPSKHCRVCESQVHTAVALSNHGTYYSSQKSLVNIYHHLID